MTGKYEGDGTWNMTGVAGARCEHCNGLLVVGDQGGAVHLIEVREDLFTAFDFNEERVAETAKRVGRCCVRGMGHASN